MRYRNASVFTDDGFRHVDFSCRRGCFTYCEEEGEESIDLTGCLVIPGLVDIHTHGRCGMDFLRATPQKLHEVQQDYLRHGVTSVIATLMTETEEVMTTACRTLAKADRTFYRGIQLEGPFFLVAKRGAHDPSKLIAPDASLVERLNEASDGMICLVCVDPLALGADAFIRRMSGPYAVSLAHTDCDYETALRAFSCGADHVTHLYNAMREMCHRAPGVPGAALEKGAWCELILDLHHVHASLARMFLLANGAHAVLISDSISPAGMPDGHYCSGGMEVQLKNGLATLADGTLAGSVISVLDALRNAVRIGVPLEVAVRAATVNAAHSVRLYDGTGTLTEGGAADLLVLRQDLTLKQVLKAGIPVYTATE